MEHIPCVDVIPSDVSRLHPFGTSNFERFHLSIPSFSRMPNSQTSLPFGVHKVYFSPTEMVAHGMSRKVPHHHWGCHPTMALLLFFIGTSASVVCAPAHPNSPNRQTLKLLTIVRSTTHNHLRIDPMDLIYLRPIQRSILFALQIYGVDIFWDSTTSSFNPFYSYNL
jgi:hypothetical protein